MQSVFTPATRRRGGSAAPPDHLRRWLRGFRFRTGNAPVSLRTEAFGSAPGSSATLARELSFSHPDSVRRCARLSENDRFSTPHLRTATPAAPHGPGPHEKRKTALRGLPSRTGVRTQAAGPHPTGRVRRAVRSSRRRPGRRHRRCPARCRRARSAPRPRPPSTGS